MKIRLLILAIIISLLMAWGTVYTAYSECVLDCIFQKGTKCVNNECVPTTGPVATTIDIRLTLTPHKDTIATVIDCDKMNMKTVRVFLTRKLPPPFASYYSSIFYFYEDANKQYQITYHFAQKDILNRYVFLKWEITDPIRAQYYGADFAFNQWENTAFKEFFAAKTCAELKASGLYFNSGISIKGDMSDLEDATFTFK